MIRKFALLLIAVVSLGGSAFACETTTGPLLAPIDPFAWAAANTDWRGQGNGQVDSLKKIVNGQVAAHQIHSSYTCAKCRSVMRVKCSDPSNCVMCSQAAGDTGKKLRAQLNNSVSSASDMGSVYAMMATMQEHEAARLEAQAKWNELQNEYTVEEEVTTADGVTEKTTKKVKVTNAADTERKNQAAALQALAAGAQQQGQAQGMMIYSYMSAAAGALTKPAPSTALYAGEDPLK